MKSINEITQFLAEYFQVSITDIKSGIGRTWFHFKIPTPNDPVTNEIFPISFSNKFELAVDNDYFFKDDEIENLKDLGKAVSKFLNIEVKPDETFNKPIELDLSQEEKLEYLMIFFS